MKKYKNFDLLSQLTLIVISSISIPFDNSGAITTVSLFVLALIQIISLIIHAAISNKSWKEILFRKIHLSGVAVVVLIMLYGLIKPIDDKYDFSGLSIIVYALIPAGAVTIFYTFITFLELKNINKSNSDL